MLTEETLTSPVCRLAGPDMGVIDYWATHASLERVRVLGLGAGL